MVKLVLRIENRRTAESVEEVFDSVPLLIGRSKICDLVLSDALASRQHCVLELSEDDQLQLVDLQSANGTFIGSEKVQKRNMDVGDEFRIGDTSIHIEKITRKTEESTVHELTPVGPPPVEEVKEVSQKSEKQATPPSETEVEPAPKTVVFRPEDQGDDLTLKTPTAFRERESKPVGQTKDWVQVSLFWKGEIVDVKCFDRGESVKVGTGANNDFVLYADHLPDSVSLLQIKEQGVELFLQPSFTGLVETRQQTESLDELRKRGRQTNEGFAAFVAFRERCLVEIGPFSFYIRAARLKLAESLDAPLVKEPLFSGVLGTVATAFVVFLIFISALSEAKEKIEEPEEIPVVTLAPPEEKPKPVVRRQPSPPPPKATAGRTPSRKVQQQGAGGQGARASGDEGQRGRERGTQNTRSRAIGFETRQPPPKRATPRGAFGEEQQEAQARRGRRAAEGVGTGSRRRPEQNRQAPSPKPKPEVRVEDQGLLGVLGGAGGGGRAARGGELAGEGLGGELEGAVAGLSRGSDIDSRGRGGRGNRGREFGGGGSSLDVGGLGTKGKGGGRSGFGLGSSGRKGEAEVSFVAEDVVVKDGLTREEIERVVRRHQNEIRACYERALLRSNNANLAGRLKVQWFVNRQGRAEQLKKLSQFGAEADLYRCVSQRIQSWQFPRPRGGLGAVVDWPFVFTKGG